MGQTRSEDLFERFCSENAVVFDAVERAEERTPDYDVFVSDQRVVVEVKELCPSEEDQGTWQKVWSSGSAAFFCHSEVRVRHKIRDAYSQLKRRSGSTIPTILVLFDNGTAGGVDAIDIKNAMYGDEVMDFPAANYQSDAILRLGQGRSCTPNANRSLSAVALMWQRQTVRLSIFHNVFAVCPLPYDWFRCEACSQFSIDLGQGDCLPEWHPV